MTKQFDRNLRPKNSIPGKLICCGLILLYFFCKSQDLSAADKIDQDLNEPLAYPFFLYQQKDYYRSISEILKLKFENDHSNQELDLLLLKNYYRTDDHFHLQKTAESILKAQKSVSSHPLNREIKKLYAVSLLKTGRENSAKTIWDECCFTPGSEEFPVRSQISGRVDPDTAKLFSTIIPGTGFLVSKAYGKAAVSFLLNAVFVYGSLHYLSHDQPATAGLFFFFELGWYFGGRNASFEAAVNYNNRLTKQRQQQWIETNYN